MESSDCVLVDDIIGNDVLQHLDFKTVNCMAGKALEITSGVISFGNSEHFLHPG